MGGLHRPRGGAGDAIPTPDRRADDYINKIVTLGTPHRGSRSRASADWIRRGRGGARAVQPRGPGRRAGNPWASYPNFAKHFPPERAADRRRDQLPDLRDAVRYSAQPAVLGAAGVRLELQPQRRAGEAGARAAAGRAEDVRPQVPRRRRLAGHVARGVRGGHALLPRRRHTPASEPARARRSRAGSTCSARARCSSACPSSRAASTSTCSTRAPRPRTATAHSARADLDDD